MDRKLFVVLFLAGLLGLAWVMKSRGLIGARSQPPSPAPRAPTSATR